LGRNDTRTEHKKIEDERWGGREKLEIRKRETPLINGMKEEQ